MQRKSCFLLSVAICLWCFCGSSESCQPATYMNSDGKPCKRDYFGIDYRGTLSVTASGRHCQSWSSQTPHTHNYSDASNFPDDSLTDAGNYCRNPSYLSLGPWCFTTDPDKTWELCDLPLCECINSTGYYYTGTLNVTESGRQCQTWSSCTPHHHTFKDARRFPDVTLADAANYCRNPDNKDRPWCFTTDPLQRWEYCELPKCGHKDCKNSESGQRYTGKMSYTVSGRQCQGWTAQRPHHNYFTSSGYYPDGNAHAAGNYCRNPTRNTYGPWCYTTDPNRRQELCNVPLCED